VTAVQRVLQLLHMVDGHPSTFDHQYVVEYDPSRPGVQIGPANFHLVTTPNLAEATRYSIAEAMELYRAVDARQPRRADGKPNRPLTVFHALMVPPETAEEIGL
jgi:hypothetical protein